VRILHVISGLQTGGAETMLYRLLSASKSKTTEHRVICLGKSGSVGNKIRDGGIHVDVLGGKGRLSAPRVIPTATRLAKLYQPDVIQGWMYDGNLAAWFIAKGCGAKFAWNVRHSLSDISHEPLGLRFVIRLSAYLSANAAVIIYNSHVSALQHSAIGFAKEKKQVIPNGFDTSVFKPDKDARTRVRTELGIPENSFLIGMIARYHPMKDHLGFIKVAGELSHSYPEAYFLLVGSGVDNDNKILHDAVERAGIHSRALLLGERQDTMVLTAALDVAVSASAWGEGFSNVVGEAMSCGVPCIATNIGDAKQLIDKTGLIVPPEDYPAMSGAISRLLSDHKLRVSLGESARSRIVENYSLDSITREYEKLWLKNQ